MAITNKKDVNVSKLAPEGHCTFREYYNSLTKNQIPVKKEFRSRIAAVTGCSESAVNGWIAGAFQPNPAAKILIEREIGISSDILFPKKESELCDK